jgi:sulfate/thiosulfate-binding protein
MSRSWTRPLRLILSLMAVASLAVLAACGGSSDSTHDKDSASSGGGTKLSLVVYSVPKPGFDKVIPLFQKSPSGKGVTFSQSYGASGDQSRKVESGLPTDVVNFSLAPDITRLVDAGLVDKDWDSGEHKGIPFGTVVTIMVRKGNPKNIHTWDDLLQPGLEVVTPNPFSSGSAKWNLLAPYAEKSDGGKNPQAGLDYLKKLITEHVKVQPKSGREATETFLQGTGDVLLTYENEGIFAKRSGEDVDYVTPDDTFKIENPVAVVNNSKHPTQAKAFVDFLYTPTAQRGWAEAGFRPVDPTVAKEFAKDFPAPKKLWTIDDLGGWPDVNDSLFDEEKGSVAKIYNEATG